MTSKSALELTVLLVAVSGALFCVLRGFQLIQAALKLPF